MHVHVCKGAPSPHATKLWLTSEGCCIVANNDSKIPQAALNEIIDVVSAQFFLICTKWREFFATDELRFYC